MILFLVCLIGAGINLSFVQGTGSTTSSSCQIATNVKSALHILGIEFDYFEKDESGLLNDLITHLRTEIPNSVTEINAVDTDKLYIYASMFAMIQAGKLDSLADKTGVKSKQYWKDISIDIWRHAFEEVALARMGTDSKNYLSTFFAEYTDLEVLEFVCGNDWSTDGRKAPAFNDGCYTGSTNGVGVAKDSRWQCVKFCRTESSKPLYAMYDVNSGNCECLNSVSGTYIDGSTPQTCTTKLVYRTGTGAPITNFEDSIKFDPVNLGSPAIDGNEIIDIKQVNLLDATGKSSLHFAALMKFSIALFEVIGDSSEDLSYELVDWRRWDAAVCGDTTVDDSKCIKQVSPIDSRTRVFPGKANLQLPEAAAFEIFPMFVEYSVAMELNETKTSSQFNEFRSEPYLKTGNPQVFPGGIWVDNIYIVYKDAHSLDVSLMLRIEGGMMNQLYLAVGTTFFGTFNPHYFTSCPVAMDHRIAGRDTYLFVATHRETVDSEGLVTPRESSVSLLSVFETEIEITDFAMYGRTNTQLETQVPGFFVTDVLYVKTIFPLLVVMDSADKDLDAQRRPTNTQIRVYRIQSFVELVLTDAVIIDNFKFTKISHVKCHDEHKLILEGDINDEYTAKYLKLSVKGKLSTELSDVLLPNDVKVPATGGLLTYFNYGRLKNNLVVPVLSDTKIHFLSSLKGDEVNTSPLTQRSSKALKCFEHKEMDVCALGRLDSEGKINFELTRFTPHSKLKVDDKAILYTMWDSLKYRIEKMYDTITAEFTTYSDRQTDYLMNSGSVVPTGSSWNLATLTASDLTVSSGGLQESTSVTMKIVNSEIVETTYTDVKSKLDILLDTVENQANLIDTKTTEFQTKYDNDALSLTSTETQSIINTNIEMVTANRVRSTDVNLRVDQLKSPVDDVVITLKDLSDKTFMKNDPKPLLGKKRFSKGLKTNNLITGSLSDSEKTVYPGTSLVKNLDVTINVPQTFTNEITASSLLVEGTAKITDGLETFIVREDLVPHIDSDDGLPGFFSFSEDVLADGLDAAIVDFFLEEDQVPNIALKAQANTINGDLTFNLPASTPANGNTLLLKENALLNNVDILDVKAKAVRTSCDGCQDCKANCADTEFQVHSPVTFTGTVDATAATVTKLNDIPWVNYIKLADFNNNIRISGTKTFTDINVGILEAETFHELTPDQLLTTNSHQDIAQDMTFTKSTTFKSVLTPPSNPCVPVDGTNLCEVFKSDLAAINNGESWISSNTIDTDLKFTKLRVLTGSDIKFDGTVNEMKVGDIVDKIVTDESKSFGITGTKTISSPASLGSVTSGDSDTNVNLVSEETTTTIDDYVNTKTTKEISGEKQFTNDVSIEDIYTVGETLINDLSVAHLLHCFVDKGDHTSDPIHVYHPMTFNKVSLPRMEMKRNPDFDSYGIAPKLEDYPTVIQFCNIPLPSGKTLDGAPSSDDNYFLPLVQNYLSSSLGVTLTRDSDFFIQAMFTCVLKDDPHLTTLNNLERTEKIKQLLNERYGLSMNVLNAKTNIELLAIVARNPLVNMHDPSKDLALLDSNNEFCVTEACIQNFEGGFDALKVTSGGNLNLLDSLTVHGVDIDSFDGQRVKLSSPNTVEGVLSFTSLSLTGQYNFGGLDIATGSNGFVSSADFASKFVNTETESDQTVTGTIDFKGKISATNIDATTFNINGEIRDVSATDDISHDLDADVTFTNLVFNSDIELKNAVSLTGTLKGVTLSEFHDAVAIGEDIPVTVDGSVIATIQGTNNPTLDISGKKVLESDFTVDNVVASKDDNGLYPQFNYLSCKRGAPIAGKLIDGSVYDEYEDVASLQECHDKCRVAMCYGLSFKAAIGGAKSSCILYSDSTSKNTDSTDYASYIYEYCYQIKVHSSSPANYLSVDSSNNLVLSQASKDLWCFIDDNMIHKKSDKAVIKSGNKLVLAAIPYTSVEGDPSPAYEKFRFVGNELLELESLSSAGNFMKSNSDLSISLDSTSSYWELEINVGIAFTELDGDVIKPRVLTVNSEQDVTGSFIVRGDFNVVNTELHADNLGDLTYDTVTATYSYNVDTSTHQIATAYTLTGDEITVTNLHSDSYVDDIADFVSLDTTTEVELLGNTKFTADVKSMNADGITVDGNVASYDLTDFNINVARTHATDLTFIEANSFVSNPNGDQTYDLVGTSLHSSVDMLLANSQISGEDKIDLADLRSKTILKDETSPVTINGKVIFNKVVINGGHFTMGDSRLNTRDIGIADDLILTSDSSVDLTNHLVDSMIINEPITISGNLFGYSPDKFLDVLYKDGDQTVTEGFTMNGDITASEDVTTNSFNGYEPSSSMIKLDAEITIDSNFDFKQTLNLNAVAVTGKVNDFDFLAKFKDSVATLAGDNTITEKWTIQPAHFDGDILGTAETKDMFINDQRVYDLNKAAGIFDHIHAVKLSAQIEANVLCEFVSDLQDTYLANQDIIHYKLVSTDKFDGASFSSSKLVNSEDLSKNFLFVLNKRDVELYYAGSGAIEKKFGVTLAIGDAAGFLPRIDHVVDVSDSIAEFKYIVFVSTGKPSSGVEMYLATINAAVSNVKIEMIGTLSNAVAVTDFGLSSVVVYRQAAGNVVLDVITLAELTTCAATKDCSAVTIEDTLDACNSEATELCEVESETAAVQVNIKARILPTKHKLLVFNQKIPSLDQNILRVLLFENTGSYTLSKSIIESSDTLDFSISILDAKVFLILSGSLLEMRELGVSSGTLEDKDLSMMDRGTYTNIVDGKNFGSENGILVVKNGNKLVDLKYNGVDGLITYSTLDIPHSILSVSSTDVVDAVSNLVVYMHSFINKDTISILKADLANPVKYVQFECAQPAVPVTFGG